jgi:uncharacterized membrane protein YphA (DoxX/SURF4 family)
MSASRIIGWVLSALIAAMLIVASAGGKFTDWEGKEEQFATMGWNVDVMFTIGIVEVVIAIMFLIPRIAFVGAILLTAYLGGAVATHVRVGEPFVFPIIFGVLIWVALGLRDPRIFSVAFTKAQPKLPTSPVE